MENREEGAACLASALVGLYVGIPQPSAWIGGRIEGLHRLRVFNVGDYAEKRNDVGELSGASRLSPYIRHGCITLTEARLHGIRQIGVTRAVKWIQELAWRQFWQLYYQKHVDAIFEDQEPPKVTLGQRFTQLPDDIRDATTGLRCMDESLQELYSTGYMHNHARMWVAAYMIHYRKIDWRVGARLFYRFLLDGDYASNTLSWQWVASTFAHKPYFFNRQNVEKFSRTPEGSTLCTGCPSLARCPFDASYEILGKRLFGQSYSPEAPRRRR